MTCREVEHFWERRLDEVRSGASPDTSERSPVDLVSHLSVCARCRARVAGYSALAQAISGLEAPKPSAGLSARVLAAVEADRGPERLPMRSVRRGSVTLVRRFSVAAAVLLAVFGLRAIWSPREGGDQRPDRLPPMAAPVVTVEETPRPLTESVAEMAEVTVAIARRTSEPAARLGREMLGSTTELPAPSEPTTPQENKGQADRLVKGLGSRLESGVKPFSEPARSAFSFLVPSFLPPEDSSKAERGV
ncbi:anti-sigma factor family protein [Tautonia marina]|uniref:anti-sigma factor family protein n=1 Tax=Tautonia marina TaxID=2653855 RepID=UPI0012603FA2|nr:hypothetical protein [Tautonia marina]